MSTAPWRAARITKRPAVASYTWALYFPTSRSVRCRRNPIGWRLICCRSDSSQTSPRGAYKACVLICQILFRWFLYDQCRKCVSRSCFDIIIKSSLSVFGSICYFSCFTWKPGYSSSYSGVFCCVFVIIFQLGRYNFDRNTGRATPETL